MSASLERKRARQRAWYARKYQTNPEWAERERERTRSRYATDHEYRERKLSRDFSRRRELIDAGLCSQGCGEGLLSGWYCWDCLSKKEFAAVLRTAEMAGLPVDRDDERPLGTLVNLEVMPPRS